MSENIKLHFHYKIFQQLDFNLHPKTKTNKFNNHERNFFLYAKMKI